MGSSVKIDGVEPALAESRDVDKAPVDVSSQGSGSPLLAELDLHLIDEIVPLDEDSDKGEAQQPARAPLLAVARFQPSGSVGTLFQNRAPTISRLLARVSTHATTMPCACCLKENIIEPADEDYRYCAHCGTSLNVGSKKPSLTETPEVALAFVKLSGLTQEDHESMANTLSSLRSLIMRAVNAMGGFAKIMGDKALIAVGLNDNESAKENKAHRLLTALHAIEKELEVWSADRGADIRMHAGVHLGKVISGVLGISGDKWFDILGSDVNYAARLLGANKGQAPLLASEAFLDAGYHHMAPHDEAFEVNLKGFDGPQKVREATIFPTAQPESGTAQSSDVANCKRSHNTPFCPSCGNTHSESGQGANELSQNRDVFVLSIDIAGFSTTSARLTPQAIALWVNEFYNAVEGQNKLKRHHGVIIGRNADEVLIRFGAPSYGNTALHAFMAAHEITQALKQQQQNALIHPIHFRIGIAKGEAFIQGGLTVGEVIERSQEIQARASLDGTAIPRDLEAYARGFFKLGKIKDIFEIVGLQQDRIELAQEKAISLPFIGRTQQAKTVEAGFAKIAEGPQTVILKGAEGSGRQGVVLHFLANHPGQLITMKGDVTSWLQDPVKAAFRNLFAQEESLGSDWSRLLNFTERFSPLPDDKIPPGFENSGVYVAALLGRYMGFQLEGYEPKGLKRLRANPQALERETRAVICHVLRELSQTKPVVLILQHLDQAEREALMFLEAVLKQLSDRPIFLIATADPDSPMDALNLPRQRTIDFPNFDLPNTTKLVQYWIADHASSEDPTGYPRINPEIVEDVFGHTDGHPLFIIELVKSYVQSGRIRRNEASGHWEFAGPSQGLSGAHLTLEDLLSARLDALNDKNKTARRLLDLAAVAQTGRQGVSRAYLEAAFNGGFETREGRASFDQALRLLVQAGYLATKSFNGIDEEYLFTPPLLATVAYKAMSGAEKSATHAKIYHFIAQNIVPGRDYLESLTLAALHAEQAHFLGESIRYYHRAILHAKELGLNAETLNLIEKAKIVLESHPSSEKNGLLFEWLLIAYGIHVQRANSGDASATLSRMVGLAAAIDQPTQWMKLLCCQVTFKENFSGSGDEKAEEWIDDKAREAEKFLPHVDDVLKAEWYNRLGYGYVHFGLLSKASQAITQAFAHASKSEDSSQRARVLQNLSIYHSHMRQLDDSLRYAREALRLFEELGEIKMMVQTLEIISSNLYHVGDYDGAIAASSRSLDISEPIKYVIASIYSNLNIAQALAAKGDLEGAVAKADLSLSHARPTGQGFHIIAALTYKAIFLSPLDAALARQSAEEAVQTDNQTIPSYTASAHLALALAQAYGDDFGAASVSAMKALQIRADKLENRRLESFDPELDELSTVLAEEGQGILPSLYARREVQSRLIRPLRRRRRSLEQAAKREQAPIQERFGVPHALAMATSGGILKPAGK